MHFKASDYDFHVFEMFIFFVLSRLFWMFFSSKWQGCRDRLFHWEIDFQPSLTLVHSEDITMLDQENPIQTNM